MEHWERLCEGGLKFVYGDGAFPPSTDSFLLSSLPRLKKGCRVCDLGCGGGVLLLLRGARKEKDPLAAMLLACWVLMNGHSLMELNFSFRPYLCVAMVFLLLPVVLYARPLAVKDGKTAKAAGAVLLPCVLAFDA